MASCWTVVLGISEFFLRQDVRDARMWDQLDFWPMHEKTGDTSNGAVVLASANDRGMPLPARHISCAQAHGPSTTCLQFSCEIETFEG